MPAQLPQQSTMPAQPQEPMPADPAQPLQQQSTPAQPQQQSTKPVHPQQSMPAEPAQQLQQQPMSDQPQQQSSTPAEPQQVMPAVPPNVTQGMLQQWVAQSEQHSSMGAQQQQSAMPGAQAAASGVVTVQCSICGLFADIKQCRARSAVAGTFDCNSCRSKQSALYRSFGQWPVPEFSELDAHLQKQFFQQAPSSSQELALAVVKHIESNQTHTQKFEKGGSYLPLSVWGNMGYDTEAIRTKSAADNIMEHPVLGQTYWSCKEK